MANYYCLMAGLPDIELADTEPGYSIAALREEMEGVLTESDKQLLYSFFFLRHDCENLVRLLKDPTAETDPNCNLTAEQYNDLMTHARELNFNVHRYPAFMSIFAREFSQNILREGYYAEDEMAYQYLDYAVQNCRNNMVRRWWKMNLDITNFLTAVLARKQGWDVGQYIKGEGDVQDMIRENNSRDFDLGKEYDYVKELLTITDEEDPVKKEKMIDAFKWMWLDEQTFFEPFSIEALFAYLCKLEMQERWAKLDVKKGEETFRQILENLRGEARVPDEFKTR